MSDEPYKIEFWFPGLGVDRFCLLHAKAPKTRKYSPSLTRNVTLFLVPISKSLGLTSNHHKLIFLEAVR